MRYIGITHRTKRTAAGEARPTMVAISENGQLRELELATEQDELNFVVGTFPTQWEEVQKGSSLDFSELPNHHLVLKKFRKNEESEGVPTREVEGKEVRIVKYAVAFDGVRKGDVVALPLGGSGDHLAYALARKAEEVGASVVRTPSFVLKNERTKKEGPVRFGDKMPGSEEENPSRKSKKRPELLRDMTAKEPATDKADKNDTSKDHVLLAKLAAEKPSLFYPLAELDRDLILARESWRALLESMQARMACEARLRQLFNGRIFTNPGGLFPEGGIEKAFDEAKASDPILKALLDEEGSREKELTKALKKLPVYREVFEPLVGVGPKIAARIIAAVVDIRRFESEAKFKAFCGVHVLRDGTLPRQRRGQLANWHGDARQALYLLGDQFNRRPDSKWGKYLLTMKAAMRARHPVPMEVEVSDGKGGTRKVKRYTDGHIHKRALWRTITRFAESLYKDWSKHDRAARAEVSNLKAA